MHHIVIYTIMAVTTKSPVTQNKKSSFAISWKGGRGVGTRVVYSWFANHKILLFCTLCAMSLEINSIQFLIPYKHGQTKHHTTIVTHLPSTQSRLSADIVQCHLASMITLSWYLWTSHLIALNNKEGLISLSKVEHPYFGIKHALLLVKV